MSSNRWCDDPQLQLEVIGAIPKKLFPGVDWVKEKIASYDWPDRETNELNIKEIVKAARERAKQAGLKTEQRSSNSRDYESGAAQSYAVMLLMQEDVEVFRLKYWGNTEAPFRPTPEGRDEAATWLYTQEKQDIAAYSEGLPGVAKVTFKLSAKNAETANESEEKLWKKYASEDGWVPWSEAMVLEMEKNIVSLVESGDAVFTGYESSGFRSERILLRPITSKSEQPSVWAIKGGTLGSLLEDVRELAAASGWWHEDGALLVLLFGSVLSAEVQRSNKFSLNQSVAFREITLRVVAPATPEDVAQAYADELEHLELNPKPFTKVQSALFQLMYKYPISTSTWTKRYEIWQRWQKNHPELTPYKDWRALRSSCNSALKRAENGWGAKSSPDRVIRTPTLQRSKQ